MGWVGAAGNLCAPTGPARPPQEQRFTPTPHSCPWGGLQGANTPGCQGGGCRHNKSGGPAAVLTGAATERTHHSPSQAGPRHGPSPMQTHRGQVRGSQTGMCADEDASPDTTTPADMQNARPDVCGHTCLYTHSHTKSPQTRTHAHPRVTHRQRHR